MLLRLGLLLCLQCRGLEAQTSRLIRSGSGDKLLYFKDSLNIELFPFNNNIPKYGSEVFSSSSGKPMLLNNFFYTSQLPSYQKIKDSDSIFPKFMGGIFLYRNDSTVDLINNAQNHMFEDSRHYRAYLDFKDNYNGYLFDSLKYFPSGLYANSIHIGQKYRMIQKNQLIYPNRDELSRLINVRRLRDFTYRFAHAISISNEYNYSLVLGTYVNGRFEAQDTLTSLDPSTLFKFPPVPLPVDSFFYRNNSVSGFWAHSCDRLFFGQRSEMGVHVNRSTISKVMDYQGYYYVDVDRESGKIIGKPQLLYENQHNPKGIPGYLAPDSNFTSAFNFVCSPDDSILYFVEMTYFNSWPSSPEAGRETQPKVRYIDLRAPKPQVQDLLIMPRVNGFRGYPSLVITPYGKLMILIRKKLLDENAKNTEFVLKTLLHTNDPQGTASAFYDAELDISLSERFGLNIYDFIRLHHEIDYDCGAEVRFTNLSDFSQGIDSFQWYFTKEDGSIQEAFGYEPQVNYTRSGDYFYKVRGFNSRDSLGYSEWYFDTLHIRIPPKPVANYEASDTVVCRYSATTFFNRSRTANIHPQKGEKWVWTFGDGSTFSTTNPMEAAQVQHTYTQTGTFSVSLFYSNGYCDSTLVRNQYIRVVEAPKPGFSVDNQHGCTPFEVHFTDTVQLHVQKKEYFFSDEGQWREISNPHFSHTFQSAGKWFAVQRLYGFTGCITQTDTQFFSVKPGFTPADTLHLHLATYQDNEHIALKWPVFAHAEAYQLHKAGATVTTEQNAYTHSIAAPGLYEYRLQAIDSCGNPTSMSATERPVFLQGEVIGNNEAALLRFSPYLGQEDLNYRILREGVPLSSFAQPDADLHDEDFKAAGGLQACYLVEASSHGNWLSRSNTLCLPYIPAVFVPNAFSPNGDGLNDVFAPSTFGISEYTLNIYNRWGELIHQGEVWNGHNALPGAYFYTLEATDNQGKRIFLKGTVSLTR